MDLKRTSCEAPKAVEEKRMEKVKIGVDIPGREWYSIKAVARRPARKRKTSEKRKISLDKPESV
ncbi:MAG: hypothetical protein Q3X66_02590 [Evtepia sp.]|nr:hypothetical protein [Evtepia sp.]